ncbi:ADP-ribosylglycohydrolase family protein [Fusibacter tunisiensis]|uniref:ADP-ribosylglycohydrolase n=1 Tax=Fusibacter tunisiensis TaxID=1008308 RepID=A0ABS2MP10_9FIRM|nr:ADP-ribosylglycohydrolase family protein [Fusibacter tunisiensis]MBM7561047.1 ADP-ribosylglycohydrolase [Fusibacter tunisiensis]
MERLKGMLYGSFIGDAFALGSHWIYDTEKLKIEVDNLSDFTEPIHSVFHSGKKKGAFTHYGDQSLLLLKSIASNKGFDIQIFKTHWLTFASKYDGYLDHATKASLQALDPLNNFGSSSDELGGVSRMAPLLFYHMDDLNLNKFVSEQTQLTHNDLGLVEIGFFIKDWILDLIIGKPLMSSFEAECINHPKIMPYWDMIKHRFNEDTVDVIKDIGQSCSCQFAFPSALYLIIKYKDNFLKAMQENILSGGDSAGRGMLIGMVLGASLGIHQIPQNLLDHLIDRSTIENFAMHKQI